MKFTAIFLLVASLCCSAAAIGQKVTLFGKAMSMQKVFREIKKQTGVAFFFDENWLKETAPVTIDAAGLPLEKVLDLCFANQPVTYSVVGKTVVIKKKTPVTDFVDALADFGIIKGKVTDEKGEPLSNVSVMVKGTTKGTSTNSNGEFSIDADAGSVLVFSIIGYKSSDYKVGNAGNASVNIQMQVEATTSSEVVVIGYGTMKKSDLSAAVSTVPNLAQAKDRPVTSVEGMIQGRVPGVTVISNGGHPNSTPKVTIRGMGSRSDESILVVVDGVPNAIYNPADVESVTILKDAASAAIYGAFTGASGVMLITTRQAGKGKTGVEYNGFVGMKSAWKTLQSLTAEDEAKVSNLAYTNAGLDPLAGWNAALNPYAQVTRTNWMDEIFRTGLIHRHTISLNTSGEKSSTMLQGRYEDEQGTLLNTYNKNLSLRFNTNYTFNRFVKLRQDLFWNNNDSRGTQTSSGYSGVILSAIYMPRSATPYYEDGSFGGVGPRDSKYLGIHGDAINPVGTLLRNKPYNRNSDVQSVTELGISSIVPGLALTSRFSYRYTNILYKNFEPMRTEPGKPSNQNYLTDTTNRAYHWIWENTLNYTKTIGRHNIGAMASMTAQESRNRRLKLAARGFGNEEDWAQFYDNAGILDQDRPRSYDEKDRNISYVGRLSYSWADRYFLTASYRYDIAARLPINKKGIGTPGVTAAWKISSEPFFKSEVIDFLKLRASWGRIGNLSSVGKGYGYPQLYPSDLYQVGNGAPLTTSLYLNSQFNPNLTWETSEQWDIGLDVTLLDKRLSFTADYFNKETFDLIKTQDTKWPNSMGLGAPLINEGLIRNTGFELSANWKDKAGEITYEVGANIATLKNRVVEIDENPKSFWAHTESWRSVLTPYRSTAGQPYYSYWLIQSEGIFQSDAEAAAYTGKDGQRIQPNAKAGDLKFKDNDGNGKIDDGDRMYMGSAFPDLTYGFNATINWKNWDFSVFLQGVSGVKLFNAFKQSTLNGSEQGYNRWDKILGAWSPENPNSDIPRISAKDANKNFQTASDWYLENGNYMRVKNVLIGYTFPKMKWNSGLRVYITADNLLTITKYSGMDPEVGGVGMDGGQFPVSRTFAIGAKLNL
ncbi:TonB-dependent receptor [Pseudoflavitalea sp. G-6-1-2]|uniref:TonB-dependent receptor n=1 Tax=Pseudoflavitalea sp. G-6-1-2 TaxID=2728841 RepID=UPI001F10BE72|nr:TonB-dependent receptor [Pseudoflavitalea sp. G-6-1-2]